MVCITLLSVQPIPILSAFFLYHPYIPLSNLKNFLIIRVGMWEGRVEVGGDVWRRRWGGC